MNFNEKLTLDSREAIVVGGKNSYHHGDLRRSLIDEGLSVARSEGPQGLGLRAVTRRVGVSANAAYRHFTNQQALVAAVAGEILEKMAEQMRTFMTAEVPSDPRAVARHRLRAVGLGYIYFAVSEPGWFETAFFGVEMDRGEAKALPDHHDTAPPFALLVEALDGMVTAGELNVRRREGAEWSCWSAVHGFAELAVHGPLRQRGIPDVLRVAERVVDDIIAGIL